MSQALHAVHYRTGYVVAVAEPLCLKKVLVEKDHGLEVFPAATLLVKVLVDSLVHQSFLDVVAFGANAQEPDEQGVIFGQVEVFVVPAGQHHSLLEQEGGVRHWGLPFCKLVYLVRCFRVCAVCHDIFRGIDKFIYARTDHVNLFFEHGFKFFFDSGGYGKSVRVHAGDKAVRASEHALLQGQPHADLLRQLQYLEYPGVFLLVAVYNHVQVVRQRTVLDQNYFIWLHGLVQHAV